MEPAFDEFEIGSEITESGGHSEHNEAHGHEILVEMSVNGLLSIPHLLLASGMFFKRATISKDGNIS